MRAIRPADHALATVGGWLRRWGWLLGLVLVSIAGALLPISGYIIVVLEGDGPLLPALLAPRMQLDPPFARPGDEVRLHVTDHTPWAYVLLTVNGAPIYLKTWKAGLGKQWTWTFCFTLPTGPVEIVFYHSCHIGCQERGRMRVGEPLPPTPPPLPTKLGLVLPLYPG
ncbi:hypothetical protein [Thermoflexus sp.]|uniref:hypothetical protein n=1 Tax=Thermoflexus sp. TaxID=1969742 RepID=UPI0017C9FBA2|nr:hypothetical protein [Thermoflexus sp.]